MWRGTRVERSMLLTPDFIGFPFLSLSFSLSSTSDYRRSFSPKLLCGHHSEINVFITPIGVTSTKQWAFLKNLLKSDELSDITVSLMILFAIVIFIQNT